MVVVGIVGLDIKEVPIQDEISLQEEGVGQANVAGHAGQQAIGVLA